MWELAPGRESDMDFFGILFVKPRGRAASRAAFAESILTITKVAELGVSLKNTLLEIQICFRVFQKISKLATFFLCSKRWFLEEGFF